jgi:hypothetical protein
MRGSVLKMCRGPDLLGHQVVRGSFEARQQAKGDVHNADCLAAIAASSVKSKVSLLKCRHEPRRGRRFPGCLDRQRLIAGVERRPLQEIRFASAECSARRSAM